MPRYRNSLNNFSNDPNHKISRRSFLALLGWGIVAAAASLLGGTFLSFLYPNALKIPSSIFSIGNPADVLASDGKMFLPKQKVFVEVARGRVRCQTAICTHLGCTVNSAQTGFKCPCHGSTYDLDGRNTGGPAPRPLTHFKIYKGVTGDLLVDKSHVIEDPAQAWYPSLT